VFPAVFWPGEVVRLRKCDRRADHANLMVRQGRLASKPCQDRRATGIRRDKRQRGHAGIYRIGGRGVRRLKSGGGKVARPRGVGKTWGSGCGPVICAGQPSVENSGPHDGNVMGAFG